MNTIGQATDVNTHFVNLFETNRGTLTKGAHEKVNRLRGKALSAFSKLGIPGSKNENYKYTNLQPFFKGDVATQLEPLKTGKMGLNTFQCEVPELETHQVYVVNGWFHQGHPLANLPKGVVISSFKDFTEKYPDLIDKYYGEAAPIDTDGMVALNTLLAQDGFVVYVPKRTVIESPIQIVNIMVGDEDSYINQRNLVIVEDDCEAKVMICDHTLTSQKFAINSVTEVFVGERSVFDVYGLQSQHNYTVQVAGTYVRQQSQSIVMTNTLTLHAGIARNNVSLHMDGQNAESHAYGLYVTDKNQHVDNFTFIDHAVPNCFSSELFKGVLDDSSSGAFTGKILVRPDAQKTNAYQSNKSLLLTNDAKVNTKPQLEIYADDVKCSHGATVGQLDENAMFYLRSRGLGEEEARILLMYAFAYEVIEKIKVEPLKEQIRGLVEKRFRGELDKCESCVVCGQLGHKLGCL
ncbi:MAG: Fe-S cluster assembly protein SufD [Breznakibacter sp.]